MNNINDLKNDFIDGRLIKIVSELHYSINELYFLIDTNKSTKIDDKDLIRSLSGLSSYLDKELDEI